MEIVHPENGGSRHLRKVDTYVQKYRAPHRRTVNLNTAIRTVPTSGLDSIVGFCS